MNNVYAVIRMRPKKQSVGCRILDSKVSEVDSAAEQSGMNRAEWIEFAIDKALGKRPRHSLLSRLAKVEEQVNFLLDEFEPSE